MYRTFKGGLRLDLNRQPTDGRAIEPLNVPKTLFVALNQDGVECQSVVKLGEYVRMYQPIGMPVSGNSCPIHSPVSGVVTSFKNIDYPIFGKSNYVVIENDFKDRNFDHLSSRAIDQLSSVEIISIARRAGIPSKGLCTTAEYKRLERMKNRKITTIICDATESEPYLTSDFRIMLEYPKQLIEGVLLAMRAVEAKEAIIAVGSEKIEAVEILQNQIKEYKEKISIVKISSKYPAGKCLVKIFDENEFQNKKPTCGVTDVFACYSLWRAIALDLPVISRNITVAGTAIGNPSNLEVRIGTPIKDILHHCGLIHDPERIILGGPISGMATDDLGLPTIKGLSGITVLTKSNNQLEELVCIRCGRCEKVCPEGLMPNYLSDYILRGDTSECLRLRISNCNLCGSCAYICPSKIAISEIIRQGKIKIAQEIRGNA